MRYITNTRLSFQQKMY